MLYLVGLCFTLGSMCSYMFVCECIFIRTQWRKYICGSNSYKLSARTWNYKCQRAWIYGQRSHSVVYYKTINSPTPRFAVLSALGDHSWCLAPPHPYRPSLPTPLSIPCSKFHAHNPLLTFILSPWIYFSYPSELHILSNMCALLVYDIHLVPYHYYIKWLLTKENFFGVLFY